MDLRHFKTFEGFTNTLYKKRDETYCKWWKQTYPSVGADVHFQAVVLAERFVAVGALVRTLT